MTSYIGVIGNAVAGAGVLIQTEQEAQILEANADSARQDARYAVLAASVRVEEIRREAGEFKGTQAAVAAANGVVSTKGSALALMIKTAATAERASQREMFAGEVEAARFITEANIYKRQALNTRITGAVQALATTLSGTTFQRGSGGSSGPRESAGRSSFDSGGQTQTQAYQDYRAGERADYSGGDASHQEGGASGLGI